MLQDGARNGLEIVVRSKRFASHAGDTLDVLGEISLNLAPGSITAILGPSGCGKTTFLRILAGLDTAFEGQVIVPKTAIGMVFQEPRLLPWRSIIDNIQIAAPLASKSLIDNLCARMGIEAHVDMYPGQLSLGLARRASIARALAATPELILLDEPFASLDRERTESLRKDIVDTLTNAGITAVIVSHDPYDAICMADRILVLGQSPAIIVEDISIETPRELITSESIKKILYRLQGKPGQEPME